jgi:hypothetical protein
MLILCENRAILNQPSTGRNRPARQFHFRDEAERFADAGQTATLE